MGSYGIGNAFWLPEQATIPNEECDNKIPTCCAEALPRQEFNGWKGYQSHLSNFTKRMPNCGFHVGKKLVGIAPIGVLCERVVCPCKALDKNYQSCLCKINFMIKERDHKFGPGCMVFWRYPSTTTKPYSLYVKLGGFGCNNLSQTLWSSPRSNCAEYNGRMNLGCGPSNVLEYDSPMNGQLPARKKRRCLRHVRAKAPSQWTCMTCKCRVKVRKKDKCNGLTSLASTSWKMPPRGKSCGSQSPYPMFQRACLTKKRNEHQCQACDPCISRKEANPRKKPTFPRKNEGPTIEQLRAWQEARAKAKCKSEGRRDPAVWGSGPILPPKKQGVKCTRGIHQKKKNMSKTCQEKHDCCMYNPCVTDNNDLYLPNPKRFPIAMPDSNYLFISKLRSRSTSPIQFQSTPTTNNEDLCLRCETSLYPSPISLTTHNSLNCRSQSHRRRSRSPIPCGSRSQSPIKYKIRCKSPSRSFQFWPRSPFSPSSMYIGETPQAQCKSPTGSSPIQPRYPPSPSSVYIDKTPQAQCRSPTRSCQIWPKFSPSPSSLYIEKTPRAQCKSPTKSCQSWPNSPSSSNSMYFDETPRARCDLYISCKDCHCHKSQDNLNSHRYTKSCLRDTLCCYCPCRQKGPNMLSMSGTSSICKPQGSPLFSCSMNTHSHNWDKVTHYTIQGTKTSFEVFPKVYPKNQVYIVESPPCSPCSLLNETSQLRSPKFESIVESSMDLPSQRCHDCDCHKQNEGIMSTTCLENIPGKQCQDCVCHDRNNGLTIVPHGDQLSGQWCHEHDNKMNSTNYHEDLPSHKCRDCDCHKQNNNLGFLAKWSCGQSCNSERGFSPSFASPSQSLTHVIHSGSPPLEQPFVEEIILPIKWQDCRLHHGYVVTSCDVVPPICQGHQDQQITHNPPMSPMGALSATRENTWTLDRSSSHLKTIDCPNVPCIYPTPQCVNCECHKSPCTSLAPPKYSMHELSSLLPSQRGRISQSHSLGHCASNGKHTQPGSPNQPMAICRKKNVHASSQCCNPYPLRAFCHCHKLHAWQDVAPKEIRSWSRNSSLPPSECEYLMKGLQSCPRELERECSTRLYPCSTPLPHNCCCGMCKSDGVPLFSIAMACPNCHLTHSCCCGTCLCPNPYCSSSPIYNSSSYSIIPTHQEVAFKLAPKSPPRPRQISSPKSQQKDIRDHLLACPNSQAHCSRQDSINNGLLLMMSQTACSRSTSPSCLTQNYVQPQSCTYSYGESSFFSRAQWPPMSSFANCCCQRCLNGQPCSSRR